MIVYIAGKISGNPECKAQFEDTKRRIKDAIRIGSSTQQLYDFDVNCKAEPVVLNPADLPEGMTEADYMRICFAMIDCADLVIFQPEWPESVDAGLEYTYCKYTGKPYITLPRSWRME